jgi:serine/threonine protein kinase
MICFECPACRKQLKVKDELAGKKGKCPGCGATLTIPAAQEQPVAAGPPSANVSPAGGPRPASDRESTLPPQANPQAPSMATGAPVSAPNHPAGGETVCSGPHHAAGEKPAEITKFLAPPQAPDEIGRLGSYRVLAILGAGGMGVVFRAEDPGLQRLVALKAMLPAVASSGTSKQRFLREARAAAAITDDNIVQIYQVGEDRGVPFLAMQLLEGEPLDRRLKREAMLPVAEVLRIGREVALGLAAAHKRGLIHRDVKPANLWLEGPTRRVKILDFGLARAAGEQTQLTQSGMILGTPAYMAPEQAKSTTVDHRCDLFSLGCVLYRMCTGELPFKGHDTLSIISALALDTPTPPLDLNPEVPTALSDLVMQLLAKKPDERPDSSLAVVQALQDIESQIYAGTSHAPVAEPLSLEKLQKSDVLLNYASIDDQPLFPGRPGWVSQLHRNLEVRIEQLSGEKVTIARLPESAVTTAVEGELLEQLPQAKAMISVVSPPFIKSDICCKEVERFWHGAEQSGGAWVNDKARLLKVLKTTISYAEIPPPLADIFSPLFGFEFFELDAETGRVREFDETFGPLLKQRFFERVYDLAYDTCQLLRKLQQLRAEGGTAREPAANRQWVYLATTTSDVQDERDRVRRELLERGHRVLPDGPLPMLARDVEAFVRQCLEKCAFAIHLLGRRYGVTPEDSSESIQALQLRLTAEVAERMKDEGGRMNQKTSGSGSSFLLHPSSFQLQRLIWLAGAGEIADERQRAFVVRVQEDPALHQGAEIIEGNLNLLKKDLIRRLAPPEEKPKVAVPARAAGGPPKLYLICDPKDEAQVEALEDYLFDQGLEVSLPAFDGDDAAAAALHQDNLRTCDAVLVYYAAAPKAWVDIKLRELLKAAGYGRDNPIAVQAVYIAPPHDHRKERYRSHQAGIIRQLDEFAAGSELDAFICQVKEACA